LVTVACGREVHLRDGVIPKILPVFELPEDAIPPAAWENLRDEVLSKGEVGAGFIQADLTAYSVELVRRLDKLLIAGGFDPLQLANQNISLVGGSLNLTHGYVEEVSSLNISGPVLVKYTSATKIIELTLPLSFKSLLISYDYHAAVLIVKVNGGAQAKVSNVKLNLHLGFNFTNYLAFVDKASVSDSGSITIKFTGLGLLDYLIDILGDALTIVLHGVILGIVDRIIDSPVHDIVNVFNKVIDVLLERNTTLTF